MITPSFSPTATERVLPKLALDFTTGTLDSRITFTRALNTATAVNSSGNIAIVNANLPRFDYDPVTLAPKGLLIEEARTNIAVYSNDVTGTGWTISGLTTSTPTNSPDGTANAVLLLEDSSSGFHRAYQAVTTTATAWTTSMYFKPAGRDWVWIRVSDNVGMKYAWFNVSTGVVGTVQSGLTASISQSKNGFYRCSVTTTTAAAGAVASMFGTANADNSNSFTGDPTKGLYFYGIQVELGAFATSYIPTTTTALTRNADVATMTGSNFSSWWTATTGASNISVIPKSTIGTKPLFQMDDNTSNNIISLRGNVANPELYIKSTTDQVQLDAGTIVENTAYKLAGTWNTNNCAAAQNGAVVVIDTSATIPVVTQARIGSDGTNYANAWIQKINYWPQRITDNETQAFSK